MNKKTKWITLKRDVLGGGNSILKGKGFYISYNSQPDGYGIPFFASDRGSSETALCKKDKFFILNGDFRKDYEKRIKSWVKCKRFYEKNKIKFNSSWSNNE